VPGRVKFVTQDIGLNRLSATDFNKCENGTRLIVEGLGHGDYKDL